ncbi:uncharacterized protein LOC132061959 [Lycium ferocissimum]|uniref:uncharacterized protein LOC132061959 n=1 Tax=Lycium ferocissimum TaxID=112874 RepID=UPI0028152A77|nr:uncharacterized protein LOC132061959 [Lycium ferocissimum]
MEWYTRITHSLIGNPARPRADGRGYATLTGQYEALLWTVQRMRWESLDHMDAPETAGYATRMVQLAEGGGSGVAWGGWGGRARAGARECRGRGAAGRGGRARGAGHREDGARGGGGLGSTELDFNYLFEDFDMSPAPWPAQETAEEPSQEPFDTRVHSSAPVDPSPASAPSISPAPGPAQETAEEPVHSSAPVDPSSVGIESSPEAHISATVVSHRRKHILNKPPRKGTQDDHGIKHVRIKRKKGDGDDGEGGRVRLRPKVILKAPTCGT